MAWALPNSFSEQTQLMVAKKKQPTLLLTLGAATVLVVGGIAAYAYLSQPKAGLGDLPTGAEVVPQDALMAISVTTDPAQWVQLRQFGTAASQAAFDQNLAQMRDRILTANGFDYQKDIQPWVGAEVTVAFLTAKAPLTAPPTPPGSPLQQPVVIVLPIRDALKAKQILEAPRSSSAKLANRVYKGFQIKETQGQGAAQSFSATVLDGKFLVVTTDPKATDQAIDTYKGAPNLLQTPGYTPALGQIKADHPFGKVYVNLPAAAAFTAASSGKPVAPQSLEQAQQSQGLAATATLEPEGIQFKSVSWLKPDSQRKFEVQNNAKLLPSRLPSDTIVMASGGNLKRFWQDYTQGTTANTVTRINPDMIRSGIKSTVGMDWEQEFLPWMDDEFAIALASAPEGSPPSLPFSLIVLAKASDRRAAETTLKKLDDAMVSRYQFKVEETQVGGQPMIAWTIPQSGVVINRGWMDGDVAFLALGAPVASALLPRPAQPLADSPAFKNGIPTGINPNNGHFFINVDEAINSKKFPILQLPPGNRDLISAVRSIGITAAISDSRSSRYDVLVTLQKGNSPAPLPSPTMPAASPSPSVSPSP